MRKILVIASQRVKLYWWKKWTWWTFLTTSNDLPILLTALLGFLTEMVSSAPLGLFLNSDTGVFSTVAFLALEFWPCYSLNFQILLLVQKGILHCTEQLFYHWHANWDRIHDHSRDMIAIIRVLLLILLNFVSGFRLELMYLSHIKHRTKNEVFH